MHNKAIDMKTLAKKRIQSHPTKGASKTIHLKKANTLTSFLSEKERQEVVSLKITGFIGCKDFEDVLDEMCDVWSEYDEEGNYIPNYKDSAAIRILDLGEATYVDGANLPYFGFRSQLETFILPHGVKSTLDGDEYQTGLSESEKLTTLVIPEGLKTIGGFNSCAKLKNLVLPDSLEEIKPFAFCGCASISSIRIPASVRVLDGSCFCGCNLSAYEVDENNAYYTAIDGVVYTKDLSKLIAFPSAYPKRQFKIPETTRIIGNSAFMDSRIEAIELPEGLSVIEGCAFQNSSVKSVNIPDSITEIGALAFRSCRELEHIHLSNGLIQLNSQLFESCPKLKKLDVPPSVRSIFYSAIAWCDGLEKLILHDGLEEIVDEGTMLGLNGQLREVVFPKTLKKVPGGVFNYSPCLTKFQIDPANPYFCIMDEALCSIDGKTLYSVPDYNRTSFVIPEGIEILAERAFAFLPKLQTIKLPSTLRVIESRAFQDCKSLKRIQIPASVVKVGIDALWSDNLRTIVIESAVPPEMTGLVRDDERKFRDVELHVPHNALSLYMNSIGWRNFKIMDIE